MPPPSTWVTGALLTFLLWMAARRLQRVYPPLDTELNSDAFWTYLPSARKLLDAPWHFLTSDPQSYHVPPLTYIWPAMLGADRASIQIANGVLFLLGMLLLWSFVRRLGGTLAAFISTALLLFHPDIASYAPQVLTEAPYFFGLTLAMYAAQRAWTDPDARARWLAALVLALDITLLTRPVLQYMLVACVALLTAWVLMARHRPAGERQATKAWLAALLVSLVVPLAFVVKNGVCFDVWGLGTGSGSGLYYGVSPFKNGSDPTFSNFTFDADVAPKAVAPETGGQPLDIRSDAINRMVAMEIVKQTSLSDNLAFFGLKLKGWLFTSTPELFLNRKIRIVRTFEWLAIGLFALAVTVKGLTSQPVRLPGPHTTTRQKLFVYVLMLLAVLGMAVQLTPILYNTRYASYFIEPWLIALTGLSVAYWVQGNFWPQRLRIGMAWRVLAVLALIYLAHAWTAHAVRRDTWRLDPYRPGPSAALVPSTQFAVLESHGMQPTGEATWTLTSEPATLVIAMDASSQAVPWTSMQDAFWRMRLAMAIPASKAPSRCTRVRMSVEPHADEINWYSPTPWIDAVPSGVATTYMLGANGTMRPTADVARITLTFNCPAGTTLQWQGMEMRQITMGEAARDFLLHGVPINPYLHAEP